MSPHLPWRPADIAAEALAAARAGAAILHLHARDPEDGRPSARLEHWQGFLPQVRAGCGAIVNMTTGGSALMTLEERLAAPRAVAPELCSLNLGTMNFALYPMLGRGRSWHFAWEEPFLRTSDDLVFRNTPRDIAGVLTAMAGARFEFECYDVGHLAMLAHMIDRGLVPGGPVFVQFVMGVLGGIPAEPAHLEHMLRTAQGLFGDRLIWSVLAAGRRQMEFAGLSVDMGGHVRVGLEDSLYLAPGRLATSNAEQVEAARALVEGAGARLATPAEARAMLGIGG
jgi:uncharacterized protein (DUF849 family)